MSDWQSSGAPEPLDELVVDDLDLIDEVTHPIRGPIFRRLKTPRSAAELAELMDVPVTRLYHHINRLEQVGLVRVAATRRVGAATERRYQVVAHSLRLSEENLADMDPREIARAAATLFDSAKLGMQRALEAGPVGTPLSIEHGILSYKELVLRPEQAAWVMTRITEMLTEIEAEDRSGDDQGERLVVFVSAYPVVD